MLEGKVAIVTGGTRGIGAGITRHLARNGVRVGAGYSRGKENADAFQAELTGSCAAPISIHQGHVDEPADSKRVFAEVMQIHGRVDFLVNNAGITVDKTMRKMSTDDWQRVLSVNLFGSFCMIKAVLEHMIERGSGRNREHQLGNRRYRQRGASELRGVKGGLICIDQDFGDGTGATRHHRQRGRTGVHRD
jgi:acetoacetyl-CoA reductase